MSALPRGIRNNNPGNIDYNPNNKWVGQLGIEDGVPNPRFAKFSDPKYGIRAIAKLLLNYRGKTGKPGVGQPGIDTPLEFIDRWAPSNENDTNAYAKAIASRLGVGVKDSINITKRDTLIKVVTGIIIHENGKNFYDQKVIEEGVDMALA